MRADRDASSRAGGPPSRVADGVGRDRDFVAGLAKGLLILEQFDSAHARLTVSEAARRSGTSPAAARRALLTLVRLEYLATDGKFYWMQPRVLMLAASYSASRALPRLVQPVLDALSERTRESASAAVLYGDEVIFVARSTARRSLGVGIGPGSRLPAFCSATGRVLLAALPDEDMAARIRRAARSRLTPLTVIDLAQSLERVRSARRDGWALCDEELELGVRSIAVPLLDREERVRAALSLSIRAERMTAEAFVRMYLPLLVHEQRRLAPLLPIY